MVKEGGGGGCGGGGAGGVVGACCSGIIISEPWRGFRVKLNERQAITGEKGKPVAVLLLLLLHFQCHHRPSCRGDGNAMQRATGEGVFKHASR